MRWPNWSAGSRPNTWTRHDPDHLRHLAGTLDHRSQERSRPTSDRVREAVFSALAHQLGTWSGLRVLDLYAGSGALGLEAVSRGAAKPFWWNGIEGLRRPSGAR